MSGTIFLRFLISRGNVLVSRNEPPPDESSATRVTGRITCARLEKIAPVLQYSPGLPSTRRPILRWHGGMASARRASPIFLRFVQHWCVDRGRAMNPFLSGASRVSYFLGLRRVRPGLCQQRQDPAGPCNGLVFSAPGLYHGWSIHVEALPYKQGPCFHESQSLVCMTPVAFLLDTQKRITTCMTFRWG